MPKFAVYYIPEGEFYRLGSSVLGYDVRSIAAIERPEAVAHNFKPEWVKNNQPYGFHLTIGNAMDFNSEDLSKIEKEIRDLLDCFDPVHLFTLRQREEDFITFWNGEHMVLRYDANDYLKIFHTLIVARVHTLGLGSGTLERYYDDRGPLAEHRVKRVQKFYSSTVFDSYSPHFTLLNPYSGQDPDRWVRLFFDMFHPFSTITVDKISLVVKWRDSDPWSIYTDISR